MTSSWKGPVAGLIGACLCAIAPSFAQTPARMGAAARIDALINEGAVREAVALFDADADASRVVDRDVLARVARAVLGKTAADAEDPAASLEACLALLEGGPAPCELTVVVTAEQSPAPFTRLRALARKLRVGSPAADRELTQWVSAFAPRDWNAVVDAAQDFPPAVAVSLLNRALVEGADDARYGAIVALSAIDHPSALPVLKGLAKRTGAPGHLVALAAVARSGDAAAREALTAMLPDLHSQDLLAAGVALSRLGDARGIEAIRQVLQGPEELIQLEAAAALARLGDPAGLSRLLDGLADPNPWVRLRSLDKLRQSPPAPSAAVWRLMADPMPWIRVRAAQTTLAGSLAAASKKAG